MVTFLEYILIIGFKNGCFSISAFPKDRRHFVSRELDSLYRLGIIRKNYMDNFDVSMTAFGKALFQTTTERLGDEAASRLKITDIESYPFAKYHLYPDQPE